MQPAFSPTFAVGVKMASTFPPQEMAVCPASLIIVRVAAKTSTAPSVRTVMNQSEALVPSAESSTVRLASNQTAQPAV